MEKAGSWWKTYSTRLAYEVCCVSFFCYVVVVAVVVVAVPVSGRYKQGIMCNSIKRREKKINKRKTNSKSHIFKFD